MELSPPFELKEFRTCLFSAFGQGQEDEAVQEIYTEALDQYFRRGLQESATGRKLFARKIPFAVVAVGGYGRGELCLHSDVDIMLLFGNRVPAEAKELAAEILFPLWDLGLDLGHAVRTRKDCLSIAGSDFQVLTSLLDARFVCGDSPTYLSFVNGFQKEASSRKLRAFGRWLLEQDRMRMEGFGDASYLLEPHLKEGIGGLRDYHHILWLSKVALGLTAPRDLEYLGVFSHREYQDLQGHVAFVTRVRNHLHHLSGRKNDRLSFEYQQVIGRRLGYQERKGLLGVEQFMGRLHAAMGGIKSLHCSFLFTHSPNRDPERRGQRPSVEGPFQVSHEGLEFISPTAIVKDPITLMKIFEESCLLSMPLSNEAKRLVREFLYLFGEGFKGSPEVSGSFIRIVRSSNAAEALDQMMETGLLCAFLPEFEQIKDRVQHDSYHVYPVGRHLIETVRFLKRLALQPDLLLLDIFSELADPEAVFLAGLLHDIGKTGKDHARRGKSLATHILKRLGCEERSSEKIIFLIEHHLLLAETATRRDLNDEKIIVQCARVIKDPERLRMLYLLTWADSKATGPRAWNEWIANLVQELFFKIMHVLEQGELATPDASRRIKKTLSQVTREMREKKGGEEPERFLEVMPPRYVLESSPRDIIRHIAMYRELGEERKAQPGTPFVMDTREEVAGGPWEVTVLAPDRPGLFSQIAGVIALSNINILSARIYTWQDGTAVDVFHVTGLLDPERSEEIWARMRDELKDTFEGGLSLEERLGRKEKPSILHQPRASYRPPEVVVDNDSSDFFTLIEVFAEDRVGLLHTITRCLFHLGLDIRIAKIATKVDQVADVFYVSDLEGQKVVEAGRVQEIKETLLDRLMRTPSQMNECYEFSIE